MASLASVTQVTSGTCNGCYELDRELAGTGSTEQSAHLLVYIHLVEVHSLDAHKVRSEEATTRRRERRKRPRAHEAQARSKSAEMRRAQLRTNGGWRQCDSAKGLLVGRKTWREGTLLGATEVHLLGNLIGTEAVPVDTENPS